MDKKQVLVTELLECLNDIEIYEGDTVYTTGNVSRLARSKVKRAIF